jgi:hypothetical protein
MINPPPDRVSRIQLSERKMMETNTPTGDPLIDDVRRVRREISAEFDHDPAKLVAYLNRVSEAVHGSLG